MIPSTSLMTMGSCMWVWIWVWEYLCLSVGAQVNKIAKGFPVECNTTVGYVEQNYAAASEMRCALLANKNAALDYISSKAVDGNDAKLSIYANEDRFLFPWWLVDLGDTYLIHKIVILPRYNNYMHHFHDIEIRVGTQLDTSGDLGTYKLFSTYKGPYPAPKWEKQLVVCERRDGVLGRYASLKRVTAEYRELIHLNEFRVYAIPAH
ncbi:putative tachylectin-like [Homarus americanus]|uniref:Putative tachylectin-like n=1 Tax=Homarus americanus TaxID=6706 RepID=A0A8J5KFG7_HOMAM|nr:putative tachylectin-like [Homarus americanus]